MKIRPVEAEFFPCGRTDITKLIVAASNFANAPKYWFVYLSYSTRPSSILFTT